MEKSEAFLRDQVSLSQRAMIPTTLKTAYDTANLIVKSDPVFSVPSAEDNRGRLIQWCVDAAFERLVTTGQWPFDYNWKHYDKPTGRYLEIRPSHSCITISQVKNPDKQPRDVGFRSNKRFETQIWLRGFEPEEDLSRGLPHVLLMHGHKDLAFAHLAVPRGDSEGGFHYKTPNLMLMPHAIPEAEIAVEDTDIEAVLSLKEDIDKWRRDHA